MTRLAVVAGILGSVLLLAGCEAQKSSNPLSPAVAGPLPGVAISAPNPVQPANGSQVASDQQPVTLTVQNASSNGQRPLSYVFEVATDNGFSNKVFTRSGIAPGDGGQTSLKLPDALATGHTYFWHAMAQDGANSGQFSSPASFNVFTPAVIQAPGLVSPINNAVTSDLQPVLIFSDAGRSGSVGQIAYVVEVATDAGFGSKVAVMTIAEEPNNTSLKVWTPLGGGAQYFWHARAYDPTTTGPWSATGAFRTPAPIAPTPTPTPSPSPSPAPTGSTPAACGSGPADDINMAAAEIDWSPSDMAHWCVTAAITSVQFTGSAFLVDFNRRLGANRWPDSPFGSGSLEYTLGMCANRSGHWACSAVVQFWYGRDLAASGAPSQVATNWFYDARWGSLFHYQPQTGEQVGLFVCAGNCRGTNGISLVHERSAVKLVTWQN